MHPKFEKLLAQRRLLSNCDVVTFTLSRETENFPSFDVRRKTSSSAKSTHLPFMSQSSPDLAIGINVCMVGCVLIRLRNFVKTSSTLSTSCVVNSEKSTSAILSASEELGAFPTKNCFEILYL